MAPAFGHVDTLTALQQKAGCNEYKKKLDANGVYQLVTTQMFRTPTTTLRQYKNRIAQQLGIVASLSTVHRYLLNKKISWKKGSTRAREADPEEAVEWYGLMDQIVTDRLQLLYGDEMHRCDERCSCEVNSYCKTFADPTSSSEKKKHKKSLGQPNRNL